MVVVVVAVVVAIAVVVVVVGGARQVSTFLQKMAIAKTIKEQLAIVATTATALRLFEQLRKAIIWC